MSNFSVLRDIDNMLITHYQSKFELNEYLTNELIGCEERKLIEERLKIIDAELLILDNCRRLFVDEISRKEWKKLKE